MKTPRSPWDRFAFLLANAVGVMAMIWGIAFCFHLLGGARPWWAFPAMLTAGVFCWAGGWLSSAAVYVLITPNE
jgi:hypothetical protein